MRGPLASTDAGRVRLGKGGQPEVRYEGTARVNRRWKSPSREGRTTRGEMSGPLASTDAGRVRLGKGGQPEVR